MDEYYAAGNGRRTFKFFNYVYEVMYNCLLLFLLVLNKL